MLIRKRMRPKTLPWGNPIDTRRSDEVLFMITLEDLLVRKI